MPSFFFDGNVKRIYEVPGDAEGVDYSYTTDGQGYRIYTPIGSGLGAISFDVQRDLWSRFQDYTKINDWTTIAFARSGGAFRGNDMLGNPQYQTNDFVLDTASGWKIVLADYSHTTIFNGNLADSDSSFDLFDSDRLTAAPSPVAIIARADALLTYSVTTDTGSGLNAQQATQLSSVAATLATPGVFSTAALANAPSSSGSGATPQQIWEYANRTLTVTDKVGLALEASVQQVLLAIANIGAGGGDATAELQSAILSKILELQSSVGDKASLNSIYSLAYSLATIRDSLACLGYMAGDRLTIDKAAGLAETDSGKLFKVEDTESERIISREDSPDFSYQELDLGAGENLFL